MIWDLPFQIGGIEVRNRIAFSPISFNWSVNGGVEEKLFDFYEQLVRGGCGMVVVGGVAIMPDGKGCDQSLCLYDEKYLESYCSLAEMMRRNGCFVSLQLMHVGGQGNPKFGAFPVSPSGVKCNATNIVPEILSIDKIRHIRERFIASAILAKCAGFHAVELHLAHGYFLHEFISEYTNRRTDEYGGDVKNRLRLVLEIISGIREKVPGLLMGVRVSGEDYIKGGINGGANKKLLPVLDNAGIAYFSITAGIYDTSKIKHKEMKKGEFFMYAREIKSMVSKPVIVGGKILDLDMAEEHLINHDCDMVSIGRGFIADPMMIEKTRKGQEFNRCTECEKCMYLRHGKKHLSCPVSDL